jgi:hypothetical protein
MKRVSRVRLDCGVSRFAPKRSRRFSISSSRSLLPVRQAHAAIGWVGLNARLGTVAIEYQAPPSTLGE